MIQYYIILENKLCLMNAVIAQVLGHTVQTQLCHGKFLSLILKI